MKHIKKQFNTLKHLIWLALPIFIFALTAPSSHPPKSYSDGLGLDQFAAPAELPTVVLSDFKDMELATPIPFIKPSRGTGTYVPGNCTFGVATWTGVPFQMGNASRWDEYARSKGYAVSKIPVKGMVAQKDGGAGHVGLVLDARLNDKGETEFLLKEMNWAGLGSVRESWQPIGSWEFILF